VGVRDGDGTELMGEAAVGTSRRWRIRSGPDQVGGDEEGKVMKR
jgi:hypothetical protein